MNGLVVFFICISAAIVSSELTPEMKAQVLETQNKCIAESGVTEETLAKIKSGDVPDDPKLPAFFMCVAKLHGVIDKDGNLHPEVLKTRLTSFFSDEAKANSLFDKCFVKKSTTEETVLNASKCMHSDFAL